VLTAAPEFLRFMADYRMLVYGALLVCLMVFRPNGLLGGVNLTGLLLRAIGRNRTGSRPRDKGRHRP
jgi:branched-chain amino acid transport system permease protein